ncbi:hypothetical protein SBC1_73020 (plasmid) [Caballeronia sp. SBC1]|jgi:hypothetical protein|nr:MULTISPECIES: hypothetical protein [unclassified Caballeronia]QIE29250.1 hypothetical protein SBC2_73260 [Caballeronia sp. SBC2]QIN67255.1 hypothetical protein SBC1_73020 [Caballeronia sp. SBC1]
MQNVAYKLAAIAALAMPFAGTASAQTSWNATHPRRAHDEPVLAHATRT